ncbi:protein EMBRYO DEFECTIVE 1674-like [Sesamum indicum]|uniref:Protein EMBRYO DEFECTIVE 1674-like n=1 Tax=Sesamum indicum TaxID=4182 RepID=A0A6I9UGD2_SESIN|nr:protein EMBRYO DEFECTIVE 1674-like [Sesamum indicum]
MPTTEEAHLSRSFRRKTPSVPSASPRTAICSSFLKQVLLHDWWLIKADADSDGKRLGVGGFTSKESHGIRSFSSAPIVHRYDAVTLKTVDGMTIMIHGQINRSRTLENGFSKEVCDDFVIGFPYYWEEFAALSADEEPAAYSVSKGIFNSDASKTPMPRDNGRNMFDDILQQSVGVGFPCSETPSGDEESSYEPSLNHKKRQVGPGWRVNINVIDVENSGPLTRSRTRLLNK